MKLDSHRTNLTLDRFLLPLLLIGSLLAGGALYKATSKSSDPIRTIYRAQFKVLSENFSPNNTNFEKAWNQDGLTLTAKKDGLEQLTSKQDISLFSRKLIKVDLDRRYHIKLRSRVRTQGIDDVYVPVLVGFAVYDKDMNNLFGCCYRIFVKPKGNWAKWGWRTMEGTISGTGDADNQFPVGAAYARLVVIFTSQTSNAVTVIEPPVVSVVIED